mmetsp:Transcript_33078/g.54719  ORF Transcript_33078/g.54719 Transcript_33078/m.54719 type:complete len:247 (-) Transcript_33078:220-960(-)
MSHRAALLGQVRDQRPDVGAPAAGHTQPELRRPQLPRGPLPDLRPPAGVRPDAVLGGRRQQLEPVDPHRARRPLHLDPLPRQLVQLLPIALQRRVHGRNLQDVAPELWKCFLQVFVCYVFPGHRFYYLSCAIQSVPLLSHSCDCIVAFHSFQVAVQDLASFPEPNHQHSSSQRIQGTPMSTFDFYPLPSSPTYLSGNRVPNLDHHIRRCPVSWLVDRKKAVKLQVIRIWHFFGSFVLTNSCGLQFW